MLKVKVQTQFQVNIMFLLLLIVHNKETNTHNTYSNEYIKAYVNCAKRGTRRKKVFHT